MCNFVLLTENRLHCIVHLSTLDSETKKKKMPANPFLLPEYEIESDTEYLPPENPEKTDEEKMKEYQQFMKSEKAPKDLQDVPLDDLDSVMKKNDKAFNKFRKRIEHNPEQVILFHPISMIEYMILPLKKGCMILPLKKGCV